MAARIDRNYRPPEGYAMRQFNGSTPRDECDWCKLPMARHSPGNFHCPATNPVKREGSKE